MILPNYDKTLQKISNDKEIYIIEENPDILVKICENNEKTKNEIKMQILSNKIILCPKIIDHFIHDNKIYILMDKIKGKTLYDLYGCEKKNIPDIIWKDIRKIIYTLYYNNIHYIDISPFNFIVDDLGKVYIIDFGDAYKCKVDWFLKDFLDGENSWNPDFE